MLSQSTFTWCRMLCKYPSTRGNRISSSSLSGTARMRQVLDGGFGPLIWRVFLQRHNLETEHRGSLQLPRSACHLLPPRNSSVRRPLPTTCSHRSCDMYGRSPIMCVTVLQSHPSVSIPTLTMERTSRPGGCKGRSSFRANASNPSGKRRRPWTSLGQSALPTVSSVTRNHRSSSVFACPLSDSRATLESTRIVRIDPSQVAQSLDTRRRDSHRRLILSEPFENHFGERGVLAHDNEYWRTTCRPRVLPIPGAVHPRDLRALPPAHARISVPPPASPWRAGHLARPQSAWEVSNARC